MCETYAAGQNILQSHYLGFSGGRVPTTIHHTGKLSLNNWIWQIRYHPQRGSIVIHPTPKECRSIPGMYSSSYRRKRGYSRTAGDRRLPQQEEGLNVCVWSSSESPRRFARAQPWRPFAQMYVLHIKRWLPHLSVPS